MSSAVVDTAKSVAQNASSAYKEVKKAIDKLEKEHTVFQPLGIIAGSLLALSFLRRE